MNCWSRRGRKFQPKRMCSSRERAWYWVRTTIRRRPEWMQFDSVKSMIRYEPPIGTAGLGVGFGAGGGGGAAGMSVLCATARRA